MAFEYEVMLLPSAGNNFGRLHRIDGIIWHTTEGGGTTRADAVATHNYQKSNPGSYNFIIYDGGALLEVPYLEASGGVNPFTDYWQPGRFPYLKENLDGPCPVAGCGGAFANPTMHHLQVSFSGRRSHLDNLGAAAKRMAATAVELVKWYERQTGRKMYHSRHSDWQTNRSDPGKILGLVLKGLAEGEVMSDKDALIAELRDIIARKNRRIDNLVERKGVLLSTVDALRVKVDELETKVERIPDLRSDVKRLREMVSRVREAVNRE